jgi:hypothetical protein
MAVMAVSKFFTYSVYILRKGALRTRMSPIRWYSGPSGHTAIRASSWEGRGITIYSHPSNPLLLFLGRSLLPMDSIILPSIIRQSNLG